MLAIRIWLRIGISEIGNAVGCLVTFYPAAFVPNALCENNHKINRKKIRLILRLNTSIIQSKRIGDYSYERKQTVGI